MNKFKKGDKIRIKYLEGDDEVLGRYAVGDVLTVNEDSEIPYCIDRNGKDQAVSEDQAELVTNMKTIREHFYDLKPVHRELALAQKPTLDWDSESRSIADALDWGFMWGSSGQGDECWCDIYDQLQDGKYHFTEQESLEAEGYRYAVKTLPEGYEVLGMGREEGYEVINASFNVTSSRVDGMGWAYHIPHAYMEGISKLLLYAKKTEAVAAPLANDAAARKEIPIQSGVLDYFPAAISAIAHCSWVGNQQHNKGQPLHWAREKSNDHLDCAQRHLKQRGTVDTDGVLHTTKAAWRILAYLQLEIEKETK
jgi:hypothetical protein